MSSAPVVSVTDELLAELDAIHQDASFVSGEPDSQEYLGSLSERAATELRRLRAEVQALRVDAGRYRHASKKESDGDIDICICRVDWTPECGASYEILTGKNAHTAIDTAMQSNTEGN